MAGRCSAQEQERCDALESRLRAETERFDVQRRLLETEITGLRQRHKASGESAREDSE